MSPNKIILPGDKVMYNAWRHRNSGDTRGIYPFLGTVLYVHPEGRFVVVETKSIHGRYLVKDVLDLEEVSVIGR